MDEKLAKTRSHERDPAPLVRELVVMAEGHPQSYSLPEVGTVIVGRAEEADVCIDDPSISRRHAHIHLGKTLQIEDAASSNGTFVAGQRIEPGQRVDVQPGDFFEVGAVVCLIRGRRSPERLRQLRSHAYFDARLQDEVARAVGTRSGVAVARLHLEEAEELEKELLDAIRPGDILARYAPNEYEVLLAGAAPAEAREICANITERFDRLDKALNLGLACYPSDGQSPEELFAAACEAALPQPADEDSLRGPDDDGIIIIDERVRQLHSMLERIARGSTHVLLLGETGVGKEVFAKRLHAASPRAQKRLLQLNCAAFTDSLLESELFGHEKGAFTGASQRKIGLIESADGGVVFLDEVGELSLGIQAKLLRVIEDGQIRRVGSTQSKPVDVMFLAATNRDLEEEIEAKRFRADLFYRLNGFSITVPPLRDRVAEIEPLAKLFITRAAQRLKAPAPLLSEQACELLLGHRWPGNIRELRNTMERAVLLATEGTIDLEHLPVENMRPRLKGGLPRALASAANTGEAPPDLTEAEQAERGRIIDALAQVLGNQTRAAELLGISRRWLITKIERYQIPRPRKRPR